MSKLVAEALDFAFKAHKGQQRKYGQGDYIQHPIRVSLLASVNLCQLDQPYRQSAIDHQQPIVAAALLHDVVEDCDVSNADVEEKFGPVVAGLVYELTDRYTREDHPSMNRAQRKRLEAERLSGCSAAAMLIKLCDIADNLQSIDVADGFAIVFAREIREMLRDQRWAGLGLGCLRDEINRRIDEIVLGGR